MINIKTYLLCQHGMSFFANREQLSTHIAEKVDGIILCVCLSVSDPIRLEVVIKVVELLYVLR